MGIQANNVDKFLSKFETDGFIKKEGDKYRLA